MRPLSAMRAELVAEEYAMTAEELNKTLSRVYATQAEKRVAAILNPPLERPRG